MMRYLLRDCLLGGFHDTASSSFVASALIIVLPLTSKDPTPIWQSLVPIVFSSSWRVSASLSDLRCISLILHVVFLSKLVRLQQLTSLVSIRCYLLCEWSTCFTLKWLRLIWFSLYFPLCTQNWPLQLLVSVPGCLRRDFRDSNRQPRTKRFPASPSSRPSQSHLPPPTVVQLCRQVGN